MANLEGKPEICPGCGREVDLYHYPKGSTLHLKTDSIYICANKNKRDWYIHFETEDVAPVLNSTDYTSHLVTTQEGEIVL